MATVQQDGLVGRTVDGRYTVLTHLADGGMGSVYAALDTRLDRQVALKIMRVDLARDPEFVRRFRREARAAARLSHPNVVGVFDQGEDDGLLFLAMEFVDGQTLRDLLEEQGALTPREALDLVAAILEGTGAAHRRDVLHRDIKPENVLVSAEGHVKVADFGLARAMGATTATGRTGPLLGTVAYLAPEQVEHGTADARTDLYAIGLVLHEMLTGRPAVAGDSPIHVAWQHVTGSLATPSSQVPELPVVLDDLVGQATRRDPAERFADAESFLAAVDAARAELPAAALDHRPRHVDPAGPRLEGDADRFRDTGTLFRRTRALSRAELGTSSPTPDEHGGATAAQPIGTGAQASVAGVTPAASHAPPIASAPASSHVAETPPTPDAPGPRGATRRRARHALLAALVVLLVVAGVGAYWWFGPPGQRTVPAVVATEVVAAEEALRAEDLVPITEEAFSETVPRGQVVSSEAATGTVLHRGSRVRLVVSKGPERYDVPDVRGRTPEEATALLADTKLAAGTTKEAYDETIEKGKVVRTEPRTGTAAKPRTAVTLVVSRGRTPVPLTGIVGLRREEAVTRLENAGLTVVVADERVFSTTVRAGSVAETAPAGRVYRGDTVTLTLSKGPEMVRVPAVQGKTEAEAVAELKAAGFEVEVNRILGGVFGTARSTDPSGGTAPKGSVVVLNIV